MLEWCPEREQLVNSDCQKRFSYIIRFQEGRMLHHDDALNDEKCQAHCNEQLKNGLDMVKVCSLIFPLLNSYTQDKFRGLTIAYRRIRHLDRSECPR